MAKKKTIKETASTTPVLTGGQQRALDAMNAGKNVHLSGEGGTGKSYVVSYFIEHLPQRKKEHLMVVAPTGIAAQNVGGTTIHRAFGLSDKIFGPDREPPVKVSDVLKNAEIIIMDEISMVRFDLFTYVVKCIRQAEAEKRKGIQLIVVGDFYQLPPVLVDKKNKGLSEKEVLKKMWKTENLENCYAFQSPLWEDCHFENIHLAENIRQSGDLEFTAALNRLRKGEDKTETVKWLNSHLTHRKFTEAPTLFAINSKANAENACHDSPDAYTFTAVIIDEVTKDDMPVPEKVRLFDGARVMSVVNGGGYQNGSLGKVTSIDREKGVVYVRFDIGTEMPVTAYTWTVTKYVAVTQPDGDTKIEKEVIGSYSQMPLKLAYGFTIHKSQGKTFDEVNIDPCCFANGQLYVALSRAKTARGIHLTQPIMPDFALTSQVVYDFYEEGDLHTIPFPNMITVTEINTEPAMQEPEAAAAEPEGHKTVTEIKSEKPARGGRREGAGRKKKNPTKVMRVPLDLVPEIEKLIKNYMEKPEKGTVTETETGNGTVNNKGKGLFAEFDEEEIIMPISFKPKRKRKKENPPPVRPINDDDFNWEV